MGEGRGHVEGPKRTCRAEEEGEDEKVTIRISALVLDKEGRW